jgi:hypothetical protein
MKQRQAKTVLFLSTGNYYPSRYAAILFQRDRLAGVLEGMAIE